MYEIRHYNPAENIKREQESIHTVEMTNEQGEVIGAAEIEYHSKPIPFYQISDLYVEFEHKSKGYASEIMGAVEKMLKEKGKAGFLVDAIIEGDPASGFYTRRGWIPVPGGVGEHVYNLPKNVGPEIFKGVVMRQKPMEERESFKGLFEN